jgi:large subunit ribosomal protein L30
LFAAKAFKSKLITFKNQFPLGIPDMTKIKITQVKSGIDRSERQKLTLKALGLTKVNASKEVEATPQILGMVRKVNHLIKVEELA